MRSILIPLLTLTAWLTHWTTKREEDQRHKEFWTSNMEPAAQAEIQAWKDAYAAEREKREALDVELANANARIVAARQDLEGIHQVSLRLLGRTRP